MAIRLLRRAVGTALAAVLVGSLPVVVSVPPAAASPRPVLVVGSVVGLKAAKPKITGVLAVGSTLTVVPGKWSAKTKFSYQWLAAGKVIKKATKRTYKLTKAEDGKQISVRVTGSLAGSRVSKASVASVRVMLAGTPKVVGQAKLGSLVRVSLGKWSSSARLSAGWLRDGKPISGATKSSYLVVAADEGHKLSVKVTGKRSGYATVAKTSAAVSVPGPVPPTVTGNPEVGSTVVASAGTWALGTVLSYQWLRNGAAIAGATTPTYILVPADGNQLVSVKVTGKLGSVTTSKTSAAVTVKNQTLRSATPTITGTPAVGKILTVEPGFWADGTSFAYQWYADGVAIKQATSSTLRPGYLEAGRKLTVAVTGSKAGFDPTTQTSAGVDIPTDAIYEVGVDLPEGTYAAPGSSKCSWLRLSRRDGNPGTDIGKEGLLGYRTVTVGKALATVHSSDPWFSATGCGRWTALSQAPTPTQQTSFSEGDFLVNTEVKPGLYDSVGVTASCWAEWGKGAEGTNVELIDWYENSTGVTVARIKVPATAYRVSSQHCGTWNWVADILPEPPDP